jgi:hypothetical protein
MLSDRTIPELTKDLATHAGDLMRNEVRLARAEAMEKIKGMGAGLVQAGIGVVLAVGAVTLAMFAIAYLLAEIMPIWGAALIVAVIGAGLGYVLIKSGVKAAASPDHLSLPRTAEQVSRDIRVVKEKTPL